MKRENCSFALIEIEISTIDDSTLLSFFQVESKLNAWFLVQRGGEEGGRKKETGRKNASERIKTRGRLKELVGSPVEHDHHRSDSVGADDGKKGLEM